VRRSVVANGLPTDTGYSSLKSAKSPHAIDYADCFSAEIFGPPRIPHNGAKIGTMRARFVIMRGTTINCPEEPEMKLISACSILVVCGLASSIEMAAAQSTSTPKSNLSASERRALAQEKKVSHWPLSSQLGKPGSGQPVSVAISVHDCVAIGARVEAHEWCETRLKCVNGKHAICITEF
jgi:hypothetical protein